MSKRRKPGDWVVVKPNCGFSDSDKPEIAQIDPYEPEEYKSPCFYDCGDDSCSEWANLWLADGGCIYHVTECQMDDIPIDFEPPENWNPPNLYEDETN